MITDPLLRFLVNVTLVMLWFIEVVVFILLLHMVFTLR